MEEATFQVTVDGETYLAFLEEKVEGHEIEKEGHAPTSEEAKAFGRGVAEDIAAAETLEQAKAKRQAAKESLENIRSFSLMLEISLLSVIRVTGRIRADNGAKIQRFSTCKA